MGRCQLLTVGFLVVVDLSSPPVPDLHLEFRKKALPQQIGMRTPGRNSRGWRNTIRKPGCILQVRRNLLCRMSLAESISETVLYNRQKDLDSTMGTRRSEFLEREPWFKDTVPNVRELQTSCLKYKFSFSL